MDRERWLEDYFVEVEECILYLMGGKGHYVVSDFRNEEEAICLLRWIARCLEEDGFEEEAIKIREVLTLEEHEAVVRFVELLTELNHSNSRSVI